MRRFLPKLYSLLFWVLLWQGGSLLVHQPLLFPAPIQVAHTCLELLAYSHTYQVLWNTFIRIALGLLLAFLLGFLLSILAARFSILRELLALPIGFMRSTPVACFSILFLFFLETKELVLLVTLFMVLPIFYGYLRESLCAIDHKWEELHRHYNISSNRYWRGIVLPHLETAVSSALELACGLAWKAGIAAELIGLIPTSIGLMLYESKVQFDMNALCAWTILILLFGWFWQMAMQKLFIYAYRRCYLQ